jgi:hypothetical protein
MASQLLHDFIIAIIYDMNYKLWSTSLWMSHSFPVKQVFLPVSCCQTSLRKKNAIFWNVTPCGCSKNRRFGGKHRIHHQVSLLVTANTIQSSYFFHLVDGGDTLIRNVRSYKSHTSFFIVTSVETSDLTPYVYSPTNRRDQVSHPYQTYRVWTFLKLVDDICSADNTQISNHFCSFELKTDICGLHTAQGTTST